MYEFNKKSCIPKIIHYCWFGGGQKSYQVQKCIKSWEKLGGTKLLSGMKLIVT